MYKNKVLLEPRPYMVPLISFSIALRPQHQLTLWRHEYWAIYIHYTLRAWLLPSFRWYPLHLPTDGWPGWV